MSSPAPAVVGAAGPYDRKTKLHALDATTSGVRGLFALGVSELPDIFRNENPEQQATPAAGQKDDEAALPPPSLPVIDLSMGDHEALVAAIRHAASDWGFFQVTGHGVPAEVVSGIIDGIRAFHESDGGEGTEKARLYTRDPARKVKYHCNLDLYRTKVASWRDSLQLVMAPDTPAPEELPDQCRDILLTYSEEMKKLSHALLELLAEALGLDRSYLTDRGCNLGQILNCHYYPPCPQPELAIGVSPHSDSGFVTVLLQDEVGGLQVRYKGQWIEVKPTPGAFVVNIGDLLQIMSNDQFKSVKHKAVLKKTVVPRVSIACFAANPWSKKVYGPIKELLSEENPPLYKETTPADYFMLHHSVGSDSYEHTKALDQLKLL